jgi:hypothetical protein
VSFGFDTATNRQTGDVTTARQGQADGESIDVTVSAVVRRPDGDVHAIHALEPRIAKVEAEPRHAPRVTDTDADVVDSEVEGATCVLRLERSGEAQNERNRHGGAKAEFVGH